MLKEMKKVKNMLCKKISEDNLEFFHTQARAIQKYYKGYMSRKYVHFFSRRRNFIKSVVKKNHRMLKSLNIHNKTLRRVKNRTDERFAKKKFGKIVKNLHHLSSTRVQPGIYSNPFAKSVP